jgi:hypothetical protein
MKQSDRGIALVTGAGGGGGRGVRDAPGPRGEAPFFVWGGRAPVG